MDIVLRALTASLRVQKRLTACIDVKQKRHVMIITALLVPDQLDAESASRVARGGLGWRAAVSA